MGDITLTNDSFSPRQLCALMATSLAAPLVTICASRSWQWVLLAAAAAGIFYIYIVWAAGGVPPRTGYGRMLRLAYGRAGGRVLMGLYWIWLLLSTGLAANMSAGAFPQDQSLPLIPLTLVLLAALVAAKGPGAACRFGGTLFLLVAALLGCNLAFGAVDIQARNLLPAGTVGEAAVPLAVLLLPAAGLFFRDRAEGRASAYLRWYLLAAALAVAVSIVCVGALGRPLAQAVEHPFWTMTRSISVLGVMERFEAVISSLLSVSFCCLLAFLLTLGGKTLSSAAPVLGESPSVWVSAALGFAAIWLAPYIPTWVWLAGSGVFWGFLPALTLGLVRGKKIAK